MDDVFGMSFLQGFGNLYCRDYRIINFRKWKLFAQRSSFNKFHGDEHVSFMFIDSIHRTDVIVVQSGGGLCFLKEARLVGFILINPVREKLERNYALEPGVFGFVDDAHTAFAQLLKNLIVRDRLTDHFFSALSF